MPELADTNHLLSIKSYETPDQHIPYLNQNEEQIGSAAKDSGNIIVIVRWYQGLLK